MKNIILFISIALLASIAHAQNPVPISQARSQGSGATVTVQGIVTADSTLYPTSGVTIYFQDATAGLSAFNAGTTLAHVRQGDSILITGTLSTFNQLLQISPVTSVIVLNSGNTLPTPIDVNLTSGFAAAYECMLVRIRRVTITGSGNFAGNTNYNISDGTLTRQIRINSRTDIVGTQIPGSFVDVSGVMSRFLANYQLLPRYLTDIAPGGGPQIISDIRQSQIATTSFDLDFETANPGTTLFFYGLTSQMTDLYTDTNLTTQHLATLTSLVPGEIYFVRAASVNALQDTSFSPVRRFATQSLSTGDIKVYFITPPDTSVALPGNVAKHTGVTIIDTLIAYINQAQETLDIAIYNWNNNGLPNLASAINQAYNRGVIVRFITDGSTATLGMSGLLPAIPRIQSPTSSAYGIMHNKFVIIDAESSNPNQPIVWTGSTNWTSGQVSTDPNNVIIVQDQSLAKAYQLEFEEMWGSSAPQPNIGNSKFGPFKSDNTPHFFNLGGKYAELYFSPSDAVEEQIIRHMETADYDLEVGTMLITRETFAQTIAATHNRGVFTGVVINDTSNAASRPPYAIMAAAIPADRLHVYSTGGTWHHKYAMADQSAPWSDPLIITGSHNWSNAANTRNDENTLVVYDDQVVNLYYQDWIKAYRANGGSVVATLSFSTIEKEVARVFPNPSNGQITVSYPNLPGMAYADISVTDTYGKTLIREQWEINTGGTQRQLDLSRLSPGLYVLVLQRGQETEIFKVQIAK
jgi:phosphatidylserine/phosphatidylglycerophosphate/cardiolipin synthase-like enzyme